MSEPIAVIGAGAWGTALAMILAGQGRTVNLWEYFPDYARELQTHRENYKFLPGITIPNQITITNDLGACVQDAAIIVLVVPSQALRGVVQKLAQLAVTPRILVSASKGIENNSLDRMSQIIQDAFDSRCSVVALSGPSHAEEVARGLPCTVVAASADEPAAEEIQILFTNDHFRVYTTSDIVGVELGGSLKNVIALAAGILDGLSLGDNAKAALLTRGLAEIARLGQACGAARETFAGLSGMGDLVVTCTSQHSRNRRVGEEIGRGRRLDDILTDMEMVAEGVQTTRSALALGQRMDVELPIIEQVHEVLFANKSAKDAVRVLMQRPFKPER